MATKEERDAARALIKTDTFTSDALKQEVNGDLKDDNIQNVDDDTTEEIETKEETTGEEIKENEENTEIETKEVEEEKPTKRVITQETFDRRIAKEVAKTKAAEAARVELEAKLAKLESKEEKRPLTDNEIEQQIKLKAEQIATENSFTSACNNLVGAAEKESKDVTERLKAYHDDLGNMPRPGIEVMLNLENGHSVLNYLLNNHDDADRIFKLNPTKMAIELTKVSNKLIDKKIKPISKAPEPPSSVSTRRVNNSTDLPPNYTHDQYWEWRNKNKRPRADN